MTEYDEREALRWLTNFIHISEDLAAALFSTHQLLQGRAENEYFKKKLEVTIALIETHEQMRVDYNKLMTTLDLSDTAVYRSRASHRINIIRDFLAKIDELAPVVKHLDCSQGLYIQGGKLFAA